MWIYAVKWGYAWSLPQAKAFRFTALLHIYAEIRTSVHTFEQTSVDYVLRSLRGTLS